MEPLQRIPPIKIIDLDLDATRPSKLAGDRRLMTLRLSARPPDEWVKCFNEAREKPRRGHWRPVEINGASIVTDCIPEEMAEWHFDDLKADVRTANEKYLLSCQTAEEVARRNEAARQSEREKMEKLKGKLKFE
jgi:hypothetical protein